MFTLPQTRASIDRLFKGLWPQMTGIGERYADCVTHAGSIHSIVNERPDHDGRIRALIQIPGVKATIASGLLWSFFPKECVPFDKHTTAYCVMDWKIIPDPRITNGTYARKCAAVVAGMRHHSPRLAAIEDLVIWSRQNRSMEFPPQ